MKRYLIAAGLGAMVFTGALGSAAALGVNGNPVAQYGEDMNLVCDPNGVNVDGFFVDSDNESTSSGVVLSDIHDDCDGKTIVATATNETGTQIGKAFNVIDSNTETITWLQGEIPMSQLYGVRLTIG